MNKSSVDQYQKVVDIFGMFLFRGLLLIFVLPVQSPEWRLPDSAGPAIFLSGLPAASVNAVVIIDHLRSAGQCRPQYKDYNQTLSF